MKLRLLAVGQKFAPWVDDAVDEYRRRMPPHLKLDVVALKPGNRRGDASKAISEEAVAIEARIKPSDHVVILDERGKDWSTRDIAGQLERWQLLGSDVVLVIGGPDGLASSVKRRANQRWSLSRLTFPHPLVRVILAEQLYRAWSLLSNHPYHRE